MLLKLGAELTAQDSSGATPMHQAAMQGCANIVRLLLNAGASPNIPNHSKQSVMRVPVAAGQLESMDLLISSGVDANEKLDGNTLLHLAASKNNNAAVLKLIGKGIDLEAKTSSGFTALHLACNSCGQTAAATVKLLVELGADKEARSNEEDTPLHLASQNQSPAAAEVLLIHGANFRAVNKWNNTPLYLAKFGVWSGVGIPEEYQAPMISLLERYCATVMQPVETPRQHVASRWSIPLHWAVRNNNTHLVRQNLDAKEPVNEKAADGSTALHYAVERSRSLEITDLLLERGADPNARRATDGYAPLHVLVSTSYRRDDEAYLMVEKLISYNADARARAANNQSVVGLAACQNLAKPIRRLLEDDAEVNSPFRDTRSALNIAAWHAHIETMKVLIEAGANLNIDDSGQVPLLEIVCSRGASKDLNRFVEGARMLLDAGADINYSSKAAGGATALGRAVFNDNLDLVKLLMDRRADPMVQRLGDGQSLVECALEQGHKDITKYLEDAGVKRDWEF